MIDIKEEWVERAAKAQFEKSTGAKWKQEDGVYQVHWREDTRAALESVAAEIRAEALLEVHTLVMGPSEDLRDVATRLSIASDIHSLIIDTMKENPHD